MPCLTGVVDNSTVRVFSLAPYNVNIEHRQPVAQGASVHAETSELFYVIDGSATMLTGGTLVGETGQTIQGGVSQKFGKGGCLSLHLPNAK